MFWYCENLFLYGTKVTLWGYLDGTFFLRYWFFLVWAYWMVDVLFCTDCWEAQKKNTWLLLRQPITKACNYGTDSVSSFMSSALLLFPWVFNFICYFSLDTAKLFKFLLYDEYLYINLHEHDTHMERQEYTFYNIHILNYIYVQSLINSLRVSYNVCGGLDEDGSLRIMYLLA